MNQKTNQRGFVPIKLQPCVKYRQICILFYFLNFFRLLVTSQRTSFDGYGKISLSFLGSLVKLRQKYARTSALYVTSKQNIHVSVPQTIMYVCILDFNTKTPHDHIYFLVLAWLSENIEPSVS